MGYYYDFRRIANSGPSAAAAGASSAKDNFLSVVRRARVSTDSGAGASKFGEYEVACQLRVASMRVQKEIVYKWSVWKRYSEFETLHNVMKKSLGWQVEAIPFPSSYVFSMNKLSPEFLDQRRYYKCILMHNKTTITIAAAVRP